MDFSGCVILFDWLMLDILFMAWSDIVVIHFIADPDRPKNDKATILTDTIQMLKDLTAEVHRLKADYEALSEESREVDIKFFYKFSIS